MITTKDENIIDELLKGEHMNDGREYRYQADWQIGTRMFHVRCDDFEEYKESVKNMESMLPSTKDFPDDTGNIAHKATEPDAGTCPKCGNPLVMATKKDGTPYKKCSTNKWDRVRKVATGCDFVNWMT